MSSAHSKGGWAGPQKEALDGELTHGQTAQDGLLPNHQMAVNAS
jgi:hypothetical protein